MLVISAIQYPACKVWMDEFLFMQQLIDEVCLIGGGAEMELHGRRLP